MAGGELKISFGEVPSKWPQKPFTSITSLKRMEKAVQFKPVGKSLGTDDRRMLVVVSVVVDIWNLKDMGLLIGKLGAYNL